MKRRLLTIICLLSCLLVLQLGCKKEAKVESEPKAALASAEPAAMNSVPVVKSTTDSAGPRIKFEKQVHDFGEIGPSTRNLWEFKFKNTGCDVLKITKVSKTCGCTPFTLEKKEYAPGESGKITGKYYSGKWSGSTNKHLHVFTNDKSNPKVELTIKADIKLKVVCEPKKLNLVLKKENADCPKITITSLDGQPFSIKTIKSIGSAITADFDRTVKATKFVIEPKVDVEKLKSRPTGVLDINLNHPQCNVVSIPFSTLARFTTEPRIITVLNVEPQKPVIRKVWILNNYKEDFEVASATSEKGIIKVLSHNKVGNRYRFEVSITPPAPMGNMKVFNDVFTVSIKGGEEIQIRCVGSYVRQKKE